MRYKVDLGEFHGYDFKRVQGGRLDVVAFLARLGVIFFTMQSKLAGFEEVRVFLRSRFQVDNEGDAVPGGYLGYSAQSSGA